MKHDISGLQELAKLKASNQELRKTNNLIVKELNSKQSMLASINDLITSPKQKIKIKKATFKHDRRMIMELMLSDIHIGKKTENFNLRVAESRLNDLVTVFTRQFELHKKSFKIEGIVVALIGDIIESQADVALASDPWEGRGVGRGRARASHPQDRRQGSYTRISRGR